MYPIEDIIQWNLANQSMNNKKLNALLYYDYVWTYVLFQKQLFQTQWISTIHTIKANQIQNYNDFGFLDISRQSHRELRIKNKIQQVLIAVYNEYGKYNGIQLESIIKQETPYKHFRKPYKLQDGNQLIKNNNAFNQLVLQYYKNRL